MIKDGWFTETLYGAFRMTYRVDELLYEAQTAHQHMVLFRNETFGRVLALDGVMQTNELDEFIYHEALAHLPIFAHGQVRRVLIVGGGDGGMAEEVLKHQGVEHVTMVEIDKSVVDFSRQYLPALSKGTFDDPRLDLVIADGAKFVEDTGADASGKRFDVIIVDSTDPIGPGKVLFTPAFYRACKACLAEGGVLVTQGGNPFSGAETIKGTVSAFRDLFSQATCYSAAVPGYVLGPMAFGWGTDDPTIRAAPLEVLSERYDASGIGDLRWWRPAMQAAAFARPGYLEAALG